MAENVKIAIQTILSEKFGAVAVEDISSLGGGCINETGKVKTNQGIFFAKWNNAKRFPQMLEAEAKGLQLLKDAHEIKIPEVIAQKIIENTQYLILEFIAPLSSSPSRIASAKPASAERGSAMAEQGGRGAGGEAFWFDFGKSLAQLHRHTSEKFGLAHDNYIGSLPQSNLQHLLWTEFFILERLEPQIKLASDSKKIDNTTIKQFSNFFYKLEKIFPDEKPALLHGDLWSGNWMIGNKGEPVIIDPAVYYGHREMDIGMTKLFGGFPPEFYKSYNDEFPLEKDWKERIDLCNLYPLMVHVNLFGGGYAIQVENILRIF